MIYQNQRHLKRNIYIFLILCFLALTVADARGSQFVDVIPDLTKSVVNISCKERANGQGSEESDFGGRSDEVKELFESADNKRNTPLGSGFIIDKTGYILTSYHVVTGTKEVIVTLHDEKEFKAKVVGHDEKLDIALLKIDGDTSFTPINFGNSDGAKVGEWVLSIGNPYGLGGTVTKGIISCRARNISSKFKNIMGDGLIDYIQTDAPINRGNSGSPLFTLDGKVIGMITAIFSETGFSSGLNFAIPSNVLQKAIKQLRVFGKMRRGWIGVSVELLEADVAESLGLEKINGVTVTKVLPQSPSSRGGLQQGDIIIAINDVAIKSENHLSKIIADAPIGSVVPIRIKRNSQEITLSIMVGYREDEAELGDVFIGRSSDVRGKDIYSAGLSLADFTPQLRNMLAVPDEIKGVVILNIMGDSDAADKDIRQGDVIVKVDQYPISSIADFVSKLMYASQNKDKVALLIFRDGTYLYRAITLRKIPEKTISNQPNNDVVKPKTSDDEPSEKLDIKTGR